MRFKAILARVPAGSRFHGPPLLVLPGLSPQRDKQGVFLGSTLARKLEAYTGRGRKCRHESPDEHAGGVHGSRRALCVPGAAGTGSAHHAAAQPVVPARGVRGRAPPHECRGKAARQRRKGGQDRRAAGREQGAGRRKRAQGRWWCGRCRRRGCCRSQA